MLWEYMAFSQDGRNLLDHSFHLAIYLLGHFTNKFGHNCTWPFYDLTKYSPRHIFHFAIYSFGHFRNKFGHNCIWSL